MVLTDNDILIFYSTTVSDDGKPYLGGARTGQQLSDNRLHNLFGKTTKDEEASGIIKFRCVYIYNNNSTYYVKNPVAFVVSDTSSSNDQVSIGWGSAKIGDGSATAVDGSIEQSLFTENDFPTNVNFFSGNNRNQGAILDDDLPPKTGKPLWIKYESKFGAQDFPFNKFVIRVQADNLKGSATRFGNTITPKVTFAVVGECDSTPDTTKIANYIIPRNPDFIATVGNNNWAGNPQFFINAFSSYMNRMLLAFGDRDVTDPSIKNQYIAAISKYTFNPDITNMYYSKTIGNVHILVIDTSGWSPTEVGSDQYNFIYDDLQKAYSNQNIDWIIVLTNTEFYRSPVPSQQIPDYAGYRDDYHEMFTQFGVVLVLQGTYNYYERYKVLGYNVNDSSSPVSFAYDGPQVYTLKDRKSFADGDLFITVGTGGHAHYQIDPQAGFSDVFDSVDFGYLWVEVDNTSPIKRTLICRFYATSRNVQAFIDEVQIVRNL